MATKSINDRLGDGGLDSVAVFEETETGQVQGLVSPTGSTLKIPFLVSQSYSPVTRESTNGVGAVVDTDYVALASVTVPGGLMGTNGVLRIVVDWSYTGSANNKRLTINWGGNQISSATVTTLLGAKYLVEIANKNSLSAQAIHNHTTYGAASRLTDQAQDTSQDVVIDFPARWEALVASETITLIGYSVWYYPGND